MAIDLDCIKTIKQLRYLLNMTQTEFSNEYKIPKRTIGNWEDGTNKCPEYVLSLLRRAVFSDFDKLTHRQKEINYKLAMKYCIFDDNSL